MMASLHIEERTGSIAVGKEADLIILRDDPSQGISAFNSIRWVIRAGHLMNREELK